MVDPRVTGKAQPGGAIGFRLVKRCHRERSAAQSRDPVAFLSSVASRQLHGISPLARRLAPVEMTVSLSGNDLWPAAAITQYQ